MGKMIFRGNTNAFFVGKSKCAIVVIPKKIIQELDLDIEKNKPYFDIYFNKDLKEIVYKFTKEEIKIA